MCLKITWACFEQFIMHYIFAFLVENQIFSAPDFRKANLDNIVDLPYG